MYEAGLYLLICLVSDNVPQLFFAGVPLLRHLFTASSGIGTSLAEVKQQSEFYPALRELITALFGRASQANEKVAPPPAPSAPDHIAACFPASRPPPSLARAQVREKALRAIAHVAMSDNDVAALICGYVLDNDAHVQVRTPTPSRIPPSSLCAVAPRPPVCADALPGCADRMGRPPCAASGGVPRLAS